MVFFVGPAQTKSSRSTLLLQPTVLLIRITRLFFFNSRRDNRRFYYLFYFLHYSIGNYSFTNVFGRNRRNVCVCAFDQTIIIYSFLKICRVGNTTKSTTETKRRVKLAEISTDLKAISVFFFTENVSFHVKKKKIYVYNKTIDN